jgi:hypothetical protein
MSAHRTLNAAAITEAALVAGPVGGLAGSRDVIHLDIALVQVAVLHPGDIREASRLTRRGDCV